MLIEICDCYIINFLLAMSIFEIMCLGSNLWNNKKITPVINLSIMKNLMKKLKKDYVVNLKDCINII